jgi:transposase
VIKPVQITSDEKEILFQWRREGSSLLVRDMAHAVLLNDQGLSAHKISQLLFRTEKTVRGWLGTFQRFRLSSLLTKYQGNTNASKLTPKQKQQVKEVLSQPPSDYGIPKEFWQVKDLKRYIRVEFGVVYESDRSYHFLFTLSRFSWKLPDKFDVKRDDQLIGLRLKEIRKEIEPLLRSPHWVVLTSDETRLVWENQSRRAWLRTDKKTILKVSRSKDYQSFLGSLNLKTGKCHLHCLSWQNQEEVIKALRKLKKHYPNKKICLVWDNARWHKGEMIRKELKKGKSLASFHLINFPPYAPDTNPQEHVWKYVRDKIAHQPTTCFREKVNNFKLAVIHRRFNYRI